MLLQFIIKSKNERGLSTLNNEGGGEILFGRQTKFKYIDLSRKNDKIYQGGGSRIIWTIN